MGHPLRCDQPRQNRDVRGSLRALRAALGESSMGPGMLSGTSTGTKRRVSHYTYMLGRFCPLKSELGF